MSAHGYFTKTYRIVAIGALGSVLLLSNTAAGQVAGGTITGTVRDSSGALIPNAQVSLKDVSTGIVRSVATDAAGLYTAPNLLPGTYEVSVSASGFSTEVQKGVTLTVGAQLELNFTIRIGQVTQRIEVTGQAPTVDLSSSTVSSVVSSTTVRELPLNGRDWTSLATLQPGVNSDAQIQMPTNTGSTERLNRGLGTQLSISGTRPQANSYRVDGINVNDYANGGPGSVQGGALGVDAIQEFSVLTANYTAEYGRTAGGVINAITRSGTNSFHGDAFEFVRNSSLDAANFFDNFGGSIKPPFRRNQFGGSGGGPIRKDRTFFFGDYEGLRQDLGISGLATVPSLDARNGIIHNDDGTITNITVDPRVVPYLPLWHVPNGGLNAPGNTGLYAFSAAQGTTENFGTARVDHKISEKDSLFGSWQIDNAKLTIPSGLNDVLQTNTTSRFFLMAEESHTFSPQLLNSFRVGYNRAFASGGFLATAINPLAANTALGALPGQNAPEIDVSGLTSFDAGVHGRSENRYSWNAFQGYDDAFYSRGIHSLKFGVVVERDQNNNFASGSQAGKFKFGTLTDFLTNQPQTFEIEGFKPSLLTERGERQTIFGTYLQDDVRWKPNLTLNLGLRYEIASAISEVQGKFATFHNVYADLAPTTGNPIFQNPTLRDFEPRVGFAWDPTHAGKTSIRGGFGIFDVLPLIYSIASPQQSAFPFFNDGSTSNLAPGTFPTGAFPLVQADNFSRTSYIQQNPHRPYVLSWNLNVQRELAPNLTATLAYIGSHGVHQLFAEDDMNIVLPTQTSAGYLWPDPVGSGTRLNPNIGRIDTRQWSNSTVYNGFEAQLAKRMSHGLQLQGSYTWSKAIDEGSAALIGDPFANSISSLYFFDPRLRRGLSDYNVGQTLTINYTWLVPTPQSLSGPAAVLAKGWEVGGILQVQGGTPFPIIIGGDPLGLNNQDPFAYPDRLVGPGCQSLVNPGSVNYVKTNCFVLPVTTPAIAAQCVPFAGTGGGIPDTCSNLLGNMGRNSIIGPGLANFDFSLFKNTYVPRISETFNVQFRAEFFNVFNHTNFASPIDNDNLFDQGGNAIGGAGLIDQTATTSREIQFAIKLIW